MAVSVLGGWLLRPNRSVLAPQPVDPEPRLAALRSAESEARRRLSELLSELPLTDEVLENPTLELPALLQRLQELDRDMRAQISKATEIAPATPPTPLPPDQEDQLSLLAGLGVPGPEPGTEPDPEIRADATAPGPHSSDADAREVARRLDGAREKLRTSLGGVEAERGALEARLGLLGDGDVEVGIATAVERYNARRTSQELARDLAQSQPALPDLRLEIQAAVSAGEEWTEDPHALTSLQRRRQELTARIESRGRDLVRSRQALERLEELPTADQVDGQVLALRRQRADLARERDRLTLIARLLRDADRRFREERQPRVLARAGEYLDHVTDGRYSQIVTAREDDREVFKLLGHAHRDPVSMETGVSTGTREQGYLALRLAAVEELDAGGERLPIFVDEVFVNWDADRRARGMELLSRISASRQVFVFTCHRQVATALEDLGGHTLMMADGRLRSLEEAR
jgi:uncharacterized protein YhaN